MSSHTSQLEARLDPPFPAERKRGDRDLRSPTIIKLPRGLFVRLLRILSFVLLDAFLLFIAHQLTDIAAQYIPAIWGVSGNSRSLLPEILICIGILAASGMYEAGERRRNYFKLTKAITLSNLLILLIATAEQQIPAFPDLKLFLFWLFSTAFLLLGRFLANIIITLVRQKGAVCHSIFVLCRPEDADRITSFLGKEPHYTVMGWQNLGPLNDANREALVEKIFSLGVSEVFLCAECDVKTLMLLYWDLRNAGITLHLSFLLPGLKLFRREKDWQIPEFLSFTFYPPLITGIDFWIKRTFDFFAAAIFLLLFSPIYLAIAVLIRLDSPGPILYKQTRIGLRNEPFQLWKFRTMVVNAAELQKELEAKNETKDGILFKIKDDPRITRTGKFLRRYSLDELPQVFNVLFGEMSFVGPRPLPVRDVEKFSESHFIRHEVLPGITGMWQVSGRSNIDDFEEVLNLDLTYMKDWSLWLDLRIILQTVGVVFKKTGAY